MSTPLPGDRTEKYDVTTPADTDYYEVFADIAGSDREAWRRARTLVDETGERMLAAWDASEYPVEVVPRMGELDLMTDGVDHPGLTHLSPLAAGLVNMELSRGDGSLGTILAVQGGLALRTLALFGSDAQKARWLQPLADGTVLGAFALTEPTHGSDSTSLETVATRDGAGWIIRGAKKWIGNGASGGITFVWARVASPGDPDDGAVRCFLVEQDVDGYEASVIEGKVALRAIHQAHIRLHDVRVCRGCRTAWRAFVQGHLDRAVRHAIRRGVVGAGARDGLLRGRAGVRVGPRAVRQTAGEIPDGSAATHGDARAADLDAAVLPGAWLTSRRRDSCGPRRRRWPSSTTPARRATSPAPPATCSAATASCSQNRVIQHLADIEAIHTYEGTESVQALLIGRDITGVGAFA